MIRFVFKNILLLIVFQLFLFEWMTCVMEGCYSTCASRNRLDSYLSLICFAFYVMLCCPKIEYYLKYTKSIFCLRSQIEDLSIVRDHVQLKISQNLYHFFSFSATLILDFKQGSLESKILIWNLSLKLF